MRPRYHRADRCSLVARQPAGSVPKPEGGLVGILLLVVVGVVVILAIWAIAIWNKIIQLRNRIDNAWSQIDVQLRRRYDLIPNLVETVKGYAAHEKETFERVVQARNMGLNAQSVGESAQAENMLTGALKSLFAVAEAYPDLKANQNFLALQEELTATEDKIAYSRQFYNDTVYKFNTMIQTIPGMFFKGSNQPREYFEVEGEVRETGAPKVQF